VNLHQKVPNFGSKMTKFVQKNMLAIKFFFVVNLNMKEISPSGGHVHVASSPFSKVAHFKILKP
jgi:hypothetical protein